MHVVEMHNNVRWKYWTLIVSIWR